VSIRENISALERCAVASSGAILALSYDPETAVRDVELRNGAVTATSQCRDPCPRVSEAPRPPITPSTAIYEDALESLPPQASALIASYSL